MRTSQAKKKRLRRVIAALVALALAIVPLLAARPKPVPVETAVVRRGVLTVSVDEAGRTRLRDRYIVSAPLGGDLTRIEARPGDSVERGAVLARLVPVSASLLDPRTRAEAAARLAAARAAQKQAKSAVGRADLALSHARGDVEQAERLVATGSMSPDAAEHVKFEARLRSEELASARFGAEMAAHDVDMAKAALSRYGESARASESFEIPSPVTGRVLRVIQASAGTVAAGAPLVEVGDPRALEVVVDVLTEDAVRIAPGARAVLERWGGPGPLAAHVRLVEPSAFTRVSALGVEEQRVSTVIDIESPYQDWALLGDGYRVEARIVVWSEDGVIAVSQSAVFRAGEAWAVFVAEGGRARRREVETGQRSATEVQILRGLSVGDVVVVHPGDRVRDGARIFAR